MVKRILVDGLYPDNIQVAVVKDDVLEEIECASSSKKLIKGNIYLAKVTRIEPGLQAAFIDYGDVKNGFISFSEIHPNYYNIPGHHKDDEQPAPNQGYDSTVGDGNAISEATDLAPDSDIPIEQDAGFDKFEEVSEAENIVADKKRNSKRYKIQEVLKRNQVLLVQAVKEIRGSKGASFTTYISLAGKYCVLMPNCNSPGGISRRVTSDAERKKLQKTFDEITESNSAQAMGLIIRTSGQGKSKKEIKTDYNYLVKQWNEIRQKTLSSNAPAFIYADDNLLKKSIVDFYDADTSEIIVQGDDAYNAIKDVLSFMSLSKRIKVTCFKEEIPIFKKFNIDEQIAALYDPVVHLKSGAYIVINKAEALTAIDINSGKSNTEKNIEETALKTNTEAAKEIARQIRIRDISGLIVIDFIDMLHSRNRRTVEKLMRDELRLSRAKVQIGRISMFGLLEISRQRLRPSFIEVNGTICKHCAGAGMVKSDDVHAATMFKMLDFEIAKTKGIKSLTVYLSTEMTIFVLNHKRNLIQALENKYKLSMTFLPEDGLKPGGFAMEVNEVVDVKAEENNQEVELRQDTIMEPRQRDGKKRNKQNSKKAEESVNVTNSSETNHEPADPKYDHEKNLQKKRNKRYKRRARAKAAKQLVNENTESNV